MNLDSNLNSVALIGFDITQGPVLKWKKSFKANNVIDIDQFFTNFYVMFRSGNDFKPKAIIFDDFQVVAFPDQMELLCVFLNNKINKEDFEKLKTIAEKEKENHGKSEQFKSESDEIKEKLIDLLKKEKSSIKKLKKHFSMSYWTIRRYLVDLEDEGKVERNTENREHLWYAD
ncbi:MAG: DeoR family transcriptional regulator [Candidatus Lokiarchaeota archaeon]|nr:DeoR family transcriptional regulator [Candidatus Lokiarchaeota archaeon]